MSVETRVETLNDNSFADALASNRGVMVDFWAPWCGPCRAIAPIIEEVSREAPAGILVGKVNVDQQPALAARFGIQAIPALLFFRDGSLVDQVVGGLPKAEILKRLDGLKA